MTQLLLEAIACQENEQLRVLRTRYANAQLELEQYISDQADAKAPFALTYSFDYNQFDNPEVRSKARTTLFNFLGFLRQTFDGLLACGRALQDVYSDCIALGANGKKIFEAWLKSADFGASRYVASSAMEIHAWFDSLPYRLQRLVKDKVQNWSVAALRQLTKVSTDLVKELVGTGKKTAAQVKTASGKKLRKNSGSEPTIPHNLVEPSNLLDYAVRGSSSHGVARKEKTNSLSTLSFPASPAFPSFAPGVRIVVTGDDHGWNGYKGIITNKLEQNGTECWWVLLDHVQTQGTRNQTFVQDNSDKARSRSRKGRS